MKKQISFAGILMTLLMIASGALSTNEDKNEGPVCGGRFTGPRGIIHTPNFPGAFPVPIRCRWVIDVSEIPSANSSIVIYLNQLYVYKGLSFTEYAYYVNEAMNYGASLITEITEGNVLEYKWLRTFRPFLVIEFTLDRLEGNHVRVLDDLLDVYGFNVTYEMTENEVNQQACSLRECSFTGRCIVSSDYSTFSCWCFDGFSGEKCNEGPLCYDHHGSPVCRNGGICRHIGAEAISCDCPANYVGDNCEHRLLDKSDDECATENCILQCPYVEKGQACNCKNGTKIYNNRSRYECRIKLSNVTSLRTSLIAPHGNLETFLAKQLTKYLKSSNISSMEDLKILSVTPTSEVTFHFFGNAEDGDKIRESLNRLVQRRRLSEISLESTHFTFQQKPALKLQTLRINQANERDVRFNDQFVLSCVTQGSYNVNFTWYKDGMLVNMSKAVRQIWYKHLPNDGSDMHTSLLIVGKATTLDSGQYTCQVVDWGVQQCKSIYVEVWDEPNVKVMPMSATIDKGSNIKLTCTTLNMRSIGIGFGWTKNRALLKLEPGSEVWEDLYPAGSILKITNAQKSAIYTCNVAQISTSVRVEVVNRTLIPICSSETAFGLWWADTAPGAEALLECPRYFVGQRVSRLCTMKDATTPEWQIPDFSSCLYEPLTSPYNNFLSLTLGYQNTTGAETVTEFWEILKSRNWPLYPGEGDRILNILDEIERYQYDIDPNDLYRANEALTRIFNRILDDGNSILTEQKLMVLLRLIQRNLAYWSENLEEQSKHLSLSSIVLDIQQFQSHAGETITHSLQIPMEDYKYPTWCNDKVTIRLWKKKKNALKSNLNGIVVVFKNISHFLPSTYVKDLSDGTDLEYQINSRLVTVAVPSFTIDKHNKIWVDLQLQNLKNQSGSWNVTCGILQDTGSWNLKSCVTSTLSVDTYTHCLCPSVGTFAVFLTARAVRVVLAKNEQTAFVVVFGCGSCLIQCLISFIVLGVFWWKHRTWLNFLKLQCCGALIGAMSIFIFAVHNSLPETSYSIIAISLEAFLLIGMSSPISQALIIYADLSHIRPSQHFQPTVIAVITGVPVLAVLSTELTHKSTGWRHESWWLICGSGVYNIFLTCATMMFFIFMLLYMGVIHKAHSLIQENVLKRESIETRIRMLHRAAVIICTIIATEASSIFYINSSSIIFHYVFASISSTLGFIIIVLYVITGEITIIRPILRKFNIKTRKGHECVSEPIKVCSKISVEAENECSLPPPPPSGILQRTNDPYMERGVAAGSIDLREYIAESSSSYVKQPVQARYVPKICVDHTPDDINLENYNTSPRKYQDQISFNDASFTARMAHYSTEVYPVGECCAYRDFAKVSYRKIDQVQASSSVVPLTTTAPECSAKVLCNAEVESRLNNALPDVTLAIKSDVVELLTTVDHKPRENVNPIPDIANTSERKQPDGEEKAPEILITDCESVVSNVVNTPVVTTTTPTTTGMLDRISHDLDYLLNRNEGP